MQFVSISIISKLVDDEILDWQENIESQAFWSAIYKRWLLFFVKRAYWDYIN